MISPPPGLSPTSTVFPVASGLSRRQPPLLLPGCDGQAPRALTGRDDSRSPEDQAARAKSPLALLWVPRLRSLSNSGRTNGFRSQRRNRSAPCLFEPSVYRLVPHRPPHVELGVALCDRLALVTLVAA